MYPLVLLVVGGRGLGVLGVGGIYINLHLNVIILCKFVNITSSLSLWYNTGLCSIYICWKLLSNQVHQSSVQEVYKTGCCAVTQSTHHTVYHNPIMCVWLLC